MPKLRQLSCLLEVNRLNKNELRKMRRTELMELLLEISKENDQLRKQLGDANRRIANREIKLKHSGSIAEAALRLNGIFEAAQAAADQYLENVKKKAEGSVP